MSKRRWRGGNAYRPDLVAKCGNRCHYCGFAFAAKKRLERDRPYEQRRTIDHVVPVSKGGSEDSAENLVLSCRRCNKLKRDTDYLEFLETKPWDLPAP